MLQHTPPHTWQHKQHALQHTLQHMERYSRRRAPTYAQCTHTATHAHNAHTHCNTRCNTLSNTCNAHCNAWRDTRDDTFHLRIESCHISTSHVTHQRVMSHFIESHMHAARHSYATQCVAVCRSELQCVAACGTPFTCNSTICTHMCVWRIAARHTRRRFTRCTPALDVDVCV